MTTETRSDVDITADVYSELAWDPKVTVTDLDVSTTDGQVTLFGTTDTYSSKYAAAAAARRVRGVRGVTNDITVDPSAFNRTDADIEADVRNALYLDTDVPLDRITVEVYDGTVTLRGRVDYYYQRTAAEEDAGSIEGVTGVADLITVESPQAMEEDISDRIASAFSRDSQLSDDNVAVDVTGSKVTLSGTVRTWSEYDAAEDSAWRAPGVTTVENNIHVTSS